MSKNPAAPAELNIAGKALWKSIASKYDLRPDELSVLLAASKTADMIAILDKEWDRLGKPFLTTGSMGQDVIHPLVGERRQQQAALARLLGQLKLPDEVSGAVGANPARAAAASRWKHGA